MAFYCTAGKDRTGLVAMLVLSSLGVDDEAILEDYVISDSVYRDLGDKDAMVGALRQEQVRRVHGDAGAGWVVARSAVRAGLGLGRARVQLGQA